MAKMGVNASFEPIQLAYLNAKATTGCRSVSSYLRELVQRDMEVDFAARDRAQTQGAAQ
ncbi:MULTISPECIES: hypothetical protein [unclassified Mesorhizobium]|uniref:hypothetical protein n=1 Tax=unclassified Mesorhizobium TaxID=325217 RepID=UPI00333C23FA